MIGIVYKIEIGDEIYIGSTIEKLKRRQTNHNSFRKSQNCKLYRKANDFNIKKIICIPLEEKEIENEEEIRLLEQEYIDKLKPSLNSQIAYTGLTKQEYKKHYNKTYKQNNKEQIKEYQHKYYENNIQYYKEHNKKYNEIRKEKIKCDICNSFVSKRYISKHKKTKKCLQAECL